MMHTDTHKVIKDCKQESVPRVQYDQVAPK